MMQAMYHTVDLAEECEHCGKVVVIEEPHIGPLVVLLKRHCAPVLSM